MRRTAVLAAVALLCAHGASAFAFGGANAADVGIDAVPPPPPPEGIFGGVFDSAPARAPEEFLQNHTHEFFRSHSRSILEQQERVLRFFSESHLAVRQGITEVVQLVTLTRQHMEAADQNLESLRANFKGRLGALNKDGEPATDVTHEAEEFLEMSHMVFTLDKARAAAKLAKEQHVEALANEPKWRALITQLDKRWHAILDDWRAVCDQISIGAEGAGACACAGAEGHPHTASCAFAAPKATHSRRAHHVEVAAAVEEYTAFVADHQQE